MRLTIGSQRSYSDVCRSAVTQKAQAGIINYRPTWGHIRVHAGTTIYKVLKTIRPQGWMLPVVPGTGWATIGGCVANDVHGKNHIEYGSFGNWVTALQVNNMIVGEGDRMFHATIGGLGLTGHIEWVDLTLFRLDCIRPYLFPLDYTPYWRLVKAFGIIQYQCVVPAYALKTIVTFMPRPLLMSRKFFGDIPSVGMMSFCRPGIAIALDYPAGTDTTVLDKIVIDAGGALNPSKTSMSQVMFRHSFLRWKEFSQCVDPGYSSDFWARVNA